MIKKIIFTFFTLFILGFGIVQVSAQDKSTIAGSVFKNSTIVVDPVTKSPSNIRVKEGDNISLQSFFNEYKKTFGLSDDNELRSYKVSADNIGQTIHRYKQLYKGIELAEVQFIIHEKNNMVIHANGNLVHNLNLNVKPSLSADDALQYALSNINADSYMWENKKNESYVKREQNNPQATMYPKGILMLSAKDFEMNPENFHLVYRFDIYTEKPMNRYYIDVEANTGEIVNKISRIQSGDVLGEGISVYNGTVSLTVADTAITVVDSSRWHTDTWNAYNGTSWWVGDPNLGNDGGYSNGWYEGLDTDPISLSGSDLALQFYHRYSVENPSGATAPYDGWDGMNVRISTDDGATWQVLGNPLPAYTSSSLYSFGEQHGEGSGIPGWAGDLTSWTNVSFDLSAYDGQIVKIRFAFASDPGFATDDGGPSLFGWQIDDITVTNSSGTLYTNDGNVIGMTKINLVKESAFIPGNYRLRQYGRGNGIATYDAKNSTSYSLSTDFVDVDSSFDSNNSMVGVSVLWGLENTYDYYLNTFGRNSFDDNGGRMISYAHFDDQWFNASWDGTRMVFGDGTSNSTPLVSLDIVAHELTHGVTDYTANLIYQDESGGLNESFSDIFGAGVEFYTLGAEANWFQGEGAVRGRSLSNPKTYGQPDTYLGQYWYIGTADGGGVHTNSGVQNYWFYLLSEGGSGVNDNEDSYSITGLGIDAASQIAYRSLSTYLVPSSDYPDARLGSMYAAIDLYGAGSPELQTVIDTWNAVGVLVPAFDQTIIIEADTVDFLAEASVSSDTLEVTITNYGLAALEISDIQITESDFEILNIPELPDTLDYLETLNLKIAFTPTQAGTTFGTISVFSDDPTTPEKHLTLRGDGFSVAPAVDDQIYAVTTQASSLFLTLNQSDATGTEVGPVGGNRIYGASIQPSTGIIVAAVISAGVTPLIRINTASGIGYSSVTVPIYNIRAIAFDSNGDLYGATYSGDLYLIDYSTGDATLIGQTGINTLSSLAINPIDGQLWGTPVNDAIYKIDKSNANATLVGNTGFSQTPAIAFDSDGNLFGSSRLSQTISSDFILIDTTTGIGTFIGPIGYSAVSGLVIKGSLLISDVEESSEIPVSYKLNQNYPNPFNPSTKIKFQIPNSGLVTLKVYDILGNEMATLVNEQKSAGVYEINFNASALSSGIYFYKLQAGNFIETRKMILLK